MGLFNRLSEPVFLKEDSNAEIQLKKLKNLEEALNEKGRKILRQDIKFLEYGIIGEKSLEFELKNSHLPMYILHDIYLELDGTSAQIDYMVFTKKLCFIIECKNLYGNITINNAGDFIRTIQYKGIKKREGIYSPITQNQRHMDLVKKVNSARKTNMLARTLSKVIFNDTYKSVVVLANPKTVLSARYAKKEVKEKVIKADQLINFIKKTNDQSKELNISDKKMLAWAQSYLDLHKDISKDYTSKYEPYKREISESAIPEQSYLPPDNESASQMGLSKQNNRLYSELKNYRLIKSRQEAIKAFYIFSNKQLKALIEKRPKNKKELRLVNGFGAAKVEKYGQDIIQIIEKHATNE
ncbi:HRDC domain-containing protein [Alkalibacterium kapii]|uniref:HRDC domain-containing protein n=1 Tax=Alkalibacterium kapii TaxID=426704 RepID=A0A511AY05_9LACT|nr:HRDC domain-containing protein [Alkalibacterium kapii]GEK92203.1 hypothetical protein AKA01nite_18250 [Alkalibacterium kapii]